LNLQAFCAAAIVRLYPSQFKGPPSHLVNDDFLEAEGPRGPGEGARASQKGFSKMILFGEASLRHVLRQKVILTKPPTAHRQNKKQPAASKCQELGGGVVVPVEQSNQAESQATQASSQLGGIIAGVDRNGL